MDIAYVYEIENGKMVEYRLIYVGLFGYWDGGRTAFCWGAVAAFNGKYLSDNPYIDDHAFGHVWHNLWSDGFHEYQAYNIKVIKTK